MPNPAFSYLTPPDAELSEESDDFSEAVQKFSEENGQDELIVKANQFGNGFASDNSSDTSGPYMPKELNARHREILRLHTLGYKNIEVARVLGCHAQLVSMVINSPLAQEFLQEIHDARNDSVKDVQDRLKEMSPFAAEIFLDIMANSTSETNRLKAAKEVLEMTGHKEKAQAHLHTHLTKADIEELKRSANGGPETVEEETTYTEVSDEDE